MRKAVVVLVFLFVLSSVAAALEAPRLVSPVGGTKTAPTPTFHWSEAPGATWYRIWINGSTGRVFVKWLRGEGLTSYTLPEENALTVGETHRWWVQGWNSEDGNGPWSTGPSFEVGRIRYYSVSPADFVPVDDAMNWRIQGNMLYHQGQTGNLALRAGVHLPHGAVVTEVQSFWKDQNSQADIAIRMQRASREGATDEMANLDSSGSSSTASSTTDSSIDEATIDNEQWSYYVLVEFANTALAASRFFYGARITYIE